MSQVFIKRCDKCGKVSDLANTPNPPGWQCLADMMHGTLASVDFCPDCLSEMGIGVMLQTAVRNRAVGALRQVIPAELPELSKALGVDDIIAKIEAGGFDEAFAAGDGVDLGAAMLEEADVVDAELVE